MVKRSKKTAPAPKRSSFTPYHAALLGAVAALAAISLLAGTRIGRIGIPAARQEGCVTGTTRLFYNMSGGSDAPADKVADFCTAILSGTRG